MNTFFVVALSFVYLRETFSPYIRKSVKRLSKDNEDVGLKKRLSIVLHRLDPLNYTHVLHMLKNVPVDNNDQEKSIPEWKFNVGECQIRKYIYTRMGLTVNRFFIDYLKLFKRPYDLYILYSYQDIMRIWGDLTDFENKFPIKRGKKSNEYHIIQRNMELFHEQYYKRMKNGITSIPQILIEYQLEKSSQNLFEFKKHIIKEYGISNTSNFNERTSFADYTANDILNELKNEITMTTEFVSQIVYSSEVKKFAEDLKNYAIEYQMACTIDDFYGLNMLYKEMINKIKYALQNNKYSSNYLNSFYCGESFFNKFLQKKCLMAKNLFAYLTLSQMKHIVKDIKL